MVYSCYTQQRILEYRSHGLSVRNIAKAATEGHSVSKTGVLKFIRKYETTGSIARRPGSGRPTKVTPEALRIEEEQMMRAALTDGFKDVVWTDETTVQLEAH